MDVIIASPWGETLAKLDDPRVARTKLHKLSDIMVITVLAVICGADNFVASALLGQRHEAWLRTFLELPHGLPSLDPLGRMFARLEVTQLRPGSALAQLHLPGQLRASV